MLIQASEKFEARMVHANHMRKHQVKAILLEEHNARRSFIQAVTNSFRDFGYDLDCQAVIDITFNLIKMVDQNFDNRIQKVGFAG